MIECRLVLGSLLLVIYINDLFVPAGDMISELVDNTKLLVLWIARKVFYGCKSI